MATKMMGSVVYNVALTEAYLCTKWYLDPSSRLATTGMGRNGGSCSWLSVSGVNPYFRAKFHLDPSNRFSHNTLTLQTGQTDRQTGHDRQQSDSIGRTKKNQSCDRLSWPPVNLSAHIRHFSRHYSGC